MSTNDERTSSQLLELTPDHPASPASGDPIRCGDRVGVALTDADEEGVVSCDFRNKVWKLPVEANDGNIDVHDAVYYDDGNDPVLNNDSGRFFGFALEAIGSGDTATIKVAHVDQLATA